MKEAETSDTPYSKISVDEKIAAIRTLLERKDVHSDGLSSFEVSYPNASKSMLKTATFHVYVDGVGAAIDWLIDIERFLEEPTNPIDYGKTFHLVYHLYNWLQFQEIMPNGKQVLIDKISDLKDAARDKDIESVHEIALDLESILKGNLNPPNLS